MHPNSKVDRSLLEEIASEISPKPKLQATSAMNRILANYDTGHEKREDIRNRDVKRAVTDDKFFKGKLKGMGANSIYVLNNYAKEVGLIDEPAWKDDVPKDVFLKYVDDGERSLQGKFDGIKKGKIVLKPYFEGEPKKKADIWSVVYIR